ncbi:phosphoinositide 3-kinase adapter protein 1 [Pseudophryne corroboree]|uniref:phosphoinositide 3-kinase adapter protein 1 n=1 Tax=Pseudophryne corroboree TaxID=495146 RepID=UPI0030813E37
METRGFYDLLILHGPDASEWCQYLVSLFERNHQVKDFAIQTYELKYEPIPNKQLEMLQRSKCILILLSGDLEGNFDYPEVLDSLRTILRPPNKVIVLFCGVIEKEDFTNVFQDWLQWKQLSSEDDPELYITAVKDIVLEDSGCDSVTDTDPECDEVRFHHTGITYENLLSIQPERIRCGVKTQIYLIFKCKLDSQIKNTVYFNPLTGPSVSLPASLQNEYILSVDSPDLPSGLVFLNVFSGDLVMCEAKITYFTDMEEICHLLDSATNPVEFMCQAFKIMPYNRETLDKLLTESLRKNIPASGLHLFGINQIEEENLSANQRDEELPTLLHFSSKYGLKNLTALLLTCPGALQAYSVSNKHGDFPNNIAEKYGFKDLRQFIDDYVETADMLKTHIKEELMNQDADSDSPYESMANLQTDLLMKCSLHPGSDEDLYETMVGLVDQYTTEDTYVDMMRAKGPSVEPHVLTSNESVLRKILQGSGLDSNDDDDDSSKEDPYHLCSDKLYDTVCDGTLHTSVAMSRPPVPVPRTDEPIDTQPYISQGEIILKLYSYVGTAFSSCQNDYLFLGASIRIRRDRQQSSDYDPFVGMKTPGQRELITLQERVKLRIISVDEAVLEFKEWQLNQKKRSDSFRYQQENLKKLRDSINRRRNENKNIKKTADLEITKPIPRGQNLEVKPQYGIYESANLVPGKKDIKRGNWKTDSSSSTASSGSNRSSTRSTLSLSSGVEGDNEDNEIPEHPQRYKPRHSLPKERPPPRPPRPPKVENRSSRRSQSTSGNWIAPPVPPRGR